MREFGEALRLLFTKLSDFLDVFDLSFLISGGMTVIALVYVGWATKLPIPALSGDRVFFIGFGALLVAYVSGLVCFTVGRFLRRLAQKATGGPWYGRGTRLDDVVRAHGLQANPRFASYFGGDGSAPASPYLYVRMWAELRHDAARGASMTLLTRYWKLAATYDGMAANALLWAYIFATAPFLPDFVEHTQHIPPAIISWSLAAMFAVAFGACIFESQRYERYQLEELAATIAAEPPSPPLTQERWDPRVPLPPLSSLLRRDPPL